MGENIYLEIDPRWKLWDCKTHKEFLDIFLVKGKFHKDVPLDIVKEYEKVEHLIAYSYFYYPLLDEAFSLTTRIFELGVNLKCAQIGIKAKSLSEKLKLLSQHVSPEFLPKWSKFRELRNMFAHPQKSQLFGTTHKGIVFFLGINLLNSLFKKKSFFEDIIKHSSSLNERIKPFANRLCFLEALSKKYLIYGVTPQVSIQKEGVEYVYLILFPVLSEFPQSTDDDSLSIDTPFYVFLKLIELNENGFKGYDPRDNELFQLTITDSPKDLETFNKFKSQYDASSVSVRELYEICTNNEASFSNERFMYDYFWD